MTPGFTQSFVEKFRETCWNSGSLTNVTNERDYRSNNIIREADRGFRSSTVAAAPREEFSSSRSIMERATPSRILGSWVDAVENTDVEGQVRVSREYETRF